MVGPIFEHGNGIALLPDRTSAHWWQDAAVKSDALLLVAPKIKFERPCGEIGKSPENGTTLFAVGSTGVAARHRAKSLGVIGTLSWPTSKQSMPAPHAAAVCA